VDEWYAALGTLAPNRIGAIPDAQDDAAQAEKVGDVGERLAHALRKDLHETRNF
jgi:hypothetical protein